MAVLLATTVEPSKGHLSIQATLSNHFQKLSIYNLKGIRDLQSDKFEKSTCKFLNNSEQKKNQLQA